MKNEVRFPYIDVFDLLPPNAINTFNGINVIFPKVL
jgi:hypothetical protein